MLAAPLLLHVPPLGDVRPPRAATHASAGLVELQADGSGVAHFFDVVAGDVLEGKKHRGGISELSGGCETSPASPWSHSPPWPAKSSPSGYP